MPNYYRIQKRNNKQMDSINVCLHLPYADVFPIGYIVDKTLPNLQKTLDQHLNKLLPDCVDQANDDCLDGLIEEKYQEVVQSINYQRSSHKMLLTTLDINQAGAMADCDFKIGEVQRDIQTIDESLAAITADNPSQPTFRREDAHPRETAENERRIGYVWDK
jgi:hypothetical protein